METKFNHKTLPISIGYSEWNKLSDAEKSDFVIVNSAPQSRASKTVNNVTNHNSKTDDLLGLGKVAETAGAIAVLPFAFVKGIFD